MTCAFSNDDVRSEVVKLAKHQRMHVVFLTTLYNARLLHNSSIVYYYAVYAEEVHRQYTQMYTQYNAETP